jgi:hypothetical protein
MLFIPADSAKSPSIGAEFLHVDREGNMRVLCDLFMAVSACDALYAMCGANSLHLRPLGSTVLSTRVKNEWKY